MDSNTRQALFAIASSNKNLRDSVEALKGFITKLLDHNKIMVFTHKQLIGVMQDISGYMAEMPTFLNNIDKMTSEIRSTSQVVKLTSDENRDTIKSYEHELTEMKLIGEKKLDNIMENIKKVNIKLNDILQV